MDSMLLAIGAFLLVLGLITVAGHGIWVMLAAIFGQTKHPSRRCVFCGRSSHTRDRCEWCGRDLATPLAAELADLDVVKRQLMRFRANGEIAPQAVDRLLERLSRYRRQLLVPKKLHDATAIAEILDDEPQSAAPLAMPLPPAPPAPPARPSSALELPQLPSNAVSIARTACGESDAEVQAMPPAAAGLLGPPPPAPAAPAILRPPAAPAPRKAPAAPPPPRRSWAEILAAFMEERNIHWGELIGGLLIVCSSTALVVSLWEHLKTIPYFRFFIFVTITSAVFGVGLYAHHRWKLASTSHGILVIATLLVPLNFIALAGMPQGTWSPAVLIPQLASLAIFTWFVMLASRVIAADAPRSLGLAVLGNSAAMLGIVPLLSANASAARFLAVGGLCAGLFAAAVIGSIPGTLAAWTSGSLGKRRDGFTSPFRAPHRARLDDAQCGKLLTLTGIAAFSAALAIGLLIVQAAGQTDLTTLLHRCAPLAAIVALPVLAAGLTLQRGTRRGPFLPQRDSSLDSYRLAGTTASLTALAGLLAAVGLAWPHPKWIIAVGLFDMLVLGWSAFRWRMPMLHAGAIAAAALTYVTAFHLLAGDLPSAAGAVTSADMLRLTLSARSGTALGGLFLVLVAVSEWLARRGLRRHAVCYLDGAAMAALLGIVLTTYHGLLHGAADALRAAVLYGVYGGGSLWLAARWRRIELGYLGLCLLAAVVPWGFAWQTATRAFGPHWGLLLATEALTMAAAALAVDRLAKSGNLHIYRFPLAHLAEAAAVLALLLAAYAGIGTDLWKSAATATCLGATCFLTSELYGSAWRTRAGQILLYVAAILGAALWLRHVQWIAALGQIADSARNLQVCGIAVVLLSLAWIVLRTVRVASTAGLRSQTGCSSPTAMNVFAFLASRSSVDRVARHALTAIQFLLVVLCLVPAVQHELSGPAAPPSLAFGPAAWLLAGLLVVAQAISLWDQWREEDLIGALLMAATIPGLVAGRFASDPQLGAPAAATALRWGLGIALLIVSAAIWQRARLMEWCRRGGCELGDGKEGRQSVPGADAIARAVAMITLAAPVIAITVCAALLRLAGTKPLGPMAPSFFANLGLTWSYLVPLGLVLTALVGHAVRERSSAYAFSAGLVLELAVTLGYALHVSLSKQAIDSMTFCMTLVQWATIAAGAWAIVWLLARRWLDVWRESSERQLPGVLMHVQIGMAVAGNAILLAGAFVSLFLDWQPWSVSVVEGRWLGWIALVLPMVALVLRGRLRPNAAGLAGMATLFLLACRVRGIDHFGGQTIGPMWGYRTLMLGWAVYALVVVLAAWWAASLRYSGSGARSEPDTFGPPQGLLRMAAVWVRAAAILAVLLGLKAAFFDMEEQLWAAAAIAVASGAGAAMAVWRRREGWAFAAAWGVNLAASLVVWHFELQYSFQEWWLQLVQANIIAVSAVALVWLAARRRLYQLRELSLGDSPFLAAQITTAVLGNVLLLVLPVAAMLLAPQALPPWMTAIGDRAGWLGLALTVAAASWYLQQTLPGNLVHALGGLLLGAGVLAACAVSDSNLLPSIAVEWRAFHCLLAAWTAAGFVLLAIGMLAKKPLAEAWVVLFSAMATGLALAHGFYDQHQPWWTAGTMLAVSGILAALALWRSRADYVYAFSALTNAAGILIWRSQEPDGPLFSIGREGSVVSFLMANVVCLAAGSMLWSVLMRVRKFAFTDDNGFARDVRRYGVQAAWFGTALLWIAVAVGAATGAIGSPHVPVKPFDWVALASIAIAAAVCLWDDSPRRGLQMLYCHGLAAIAMGLWSTDLAPQRFQWIAGEALAVYTLAAAGAGWLLPRMRSVWAALRMPQATEDQREWFSLAQAWPAALAAGLAVWMSTDASFNEFGTRIAELWPLMRTSGPLALLGLLGTTILMAAVCRMDLRVRPTSDDRTGGLWCRAAWQSSSFACAVLLGSCMRWSLIDPSIAAAWLHGSIGVVVAAATTIVAGAGLMSALPGGSDWILSWRKSVPCIAALAAAMTFCVLVQEGVRFESKLGVPLAAWEIAVVAAMFVAMSATGIAVAVVPRWDPLRQDDRQRQVYVYLAVAVGLLLGFHLRYSMPWLFQGYFRLYWMFVVLAGAFLGAGLSEWFHRRKMPVLAVPLERTVMLVPLLPALGFWLMPDPTGPWGLLGRSPLMWFMMALFYAMMAATRRSGLAAVLSVLAGNLGLWLVLHESNIYFVQHPQIWLIPLALAALAAEHLQRDRIAEPQRLAVRYVALSVIYVSSTADMYIAGLKDWRLALALMLLSVAGVLLGILLRVRSFLYLGVTFLVVDLASMLFYAALLRGHTWVLYASGIALGAAIIALFAIFEKRRNDVLAAVQRLGTWQR